MCEAKQRGCNTKEWYMKVALGNSIAQAVHYRKIKKKKWMKGIRYFLTKANFYLELFLLNQFKTSFAFKDKY